MGKGFKHGGGGGSELNFRVIGAAEQPAGLRENDIWVACEGMTGWVFSATEPVAEEGMVWISIGTASGVAFNALKKNTVMVYPLSAKQYSGGAWAVVNAKSYQGGELVSWWAEGTLFENGTDDTEVTGGWKYYDYNVSSNFGSPNSVTVDIGVDALEISMSNINGGSSNFDAFIAPVNTIDIDGKNTLEMDFKEAAASVAKTAIIQIRLYSSTGTLVAEGPTVLTSDGAFTSKVSMDISGFSGSIRPGIAMWCWNKSSVVTAKMTRCRAH